MSTKTNFEILKKIFNDQSCKVIVEYDGGGDSGDYDITEDIPEYILDTPCTFFTDNTSYNSTVKDMIISLAESAVYEKHKGWENNEGGYGIVTFNFKEDLIIIDHNEYFLEVKKTLTKVNI
jgi:hypothetical protein